MKEYKIKDCMFVDCSQAGYEAIRDCYTHCDEWFVAENDQDAIKLVEHWQSIDDAAARAVIDDMEKRGENTDDIEQAYDNAPCYVNCVYDDETDEQIEY